MSSLPCLNLIHENSKENSIDHAEESEVDWTIRSRISMSHHMSELVVCVSSSSGQASDEGAHCFDHESTHGPCELSLHMAIAISLPS